MKQSDSTNIQLISHTGKLVEKTKMKRFLDKRKLDDNWKAISIIGPQSSGKSTLMNVTFGTEFKVLNEEESGRQQTTTGVWLSSSELSR